MELRKKYLYNAIHAIRFDDNYKRIIRGVTLYTFPVMFRLCI